MFTAAKLKMKQAGRPARRVVVGLSLVGVVLAGNAAIGIAGDDAGRDGTTVPGAPSDAPTPVVGDSDRGSGDATPGAPVANAPLGRTAESAGPVDNGRGGLDPAQGPLPIARSAEVSTAAPSGEFDTDSGEAPVMNAGTATAPGRAADTSPGDQDVPGAPTGVEVGTNDASNDQDG